MYYIMIGVIIVMIVGTITSSIFGTSDIDTLDSKLFVPPIAKWIENRRKFKRSCSMKNDDIALEEVSMLKK